MCILSHLKEFLRSKPIKILSENDNMKSERRCYQNCITNLDKESAFFKEHFYMADQFF